MLAVSCRPIPRGFIIIQDEAATEQSSPAPALIFSHERTSTITWSRRFGDPIQPPKGKTIATLKDAAAYIMALPKSEQQSPEWQAGGWVDCRDFGAAKDFSN
jgi:hypothetical protein